jgi:hypothetical protein
VWPNKKKRGVSTESPLLNPSLPSEKKGRFVLSKKSRGRPPPPRRSKRPHIIRLEESVCHSVFCWTRSPETWRPGGGVGAAASGPRARVSNPCSALIVHKAHCGCMPLPGRSSRRGGVLACLLLIELREQQGRTEGTTRSDTPAHVSDDGCRRRRRTILTHRALPLPHTTKHRAGGGGSSSEQRAQPACVPPARASPVDTRRGTAWREGLANRA